MRTRLGDILRRIRMEKKHKLKDMADILGVSSSFLSAVENGKKNMPNYWIKTLKKYYGIDERLIEDLKQAVVELQDNIYINTKNISGVKKGLAVSFARKFDDIDEETSIKILKLLNNSEEDE